MELNIGHIVWARHTKDNIYWPGKITMISNNTNDLWSNELFDNNFQQQSTYLVQFFITNQSYWTNDIFPYYQYREYMTNPSFIQYGLHPMIKDNFLNAIYQADYACNDQSNANNSSDTSTTTYRSTQENQEQTFLSIFEENTDNNTLLMSRSEIVSNNGYHFSSLSNPNIQPLSTYDTKNSNKITTNDWYKGQGLLVESITPPMPVENDYQAEDLSSLNNYQKETSLILITSKTYANFSFINYIFNSLANVFQLTLLYIEDLIDYQHPNSYNITYLICFDEFDSIIQQQLNSTILNNLNAHVNYLFLIINSPCYDLIKHFYTTIIDKRIILVLHYHSTFDNEPLLLCSGNRITYDKIQSSLLIYLCKKLKYIESNENENEPLYSSYSVSSIMKSTNILNHFINDQFQNIINENFDSKFLENNQSIINELFPLNIINKTSTNNSNNLLDFIHQSNEDILTNTSKQTIVMNDLFQTRAIKTQVPPPICEYYVQNILRKQ